MILILDRLEPSRRLKISTVTDGYSRESLAIEVGLSINAETVISVLDRSVPQRGFPKHVRSDNGSGFAGQVMKDWFSASGVEGSFAEKGPPWQDGYSGSFNSLFRDECFEHEWILSVA